MLEERESSLTRSEMRDHPRAEAAAVKMQALVQASAAHMRFKALKVSVLCLSLAVEHAHANERGRARRLPEAAAVARAHRAARNVGVAQDHVRLAKTHAARVHRGAKP